jgi:hypothetical protein
MKTKKFINNPENLVRGWRIPPFGMYAIMSDAGKDVGQSLRKAAEAACRGATATRNFVAKFISVL